MPANENFREWLETVSSWDFTKKSVYKVDQWVLTEYVPTSIKEKLLVEYQKSVQTTLQEILSQEKEEAAIYQELEDYLTANWESIKGSCLGYTATPYAETTKLLCKIAEELSKYKNEGLTEEQEPLTPIQLLMPGLNVESHHSNYPTFSAIPKAPQLTQSERNRLLEINTQLSRAKFPFDNPDAYLLLTEEENKAENKLRRALFKKEITEPLTPDVYKNLEIDRKTVQKLIDIRQFNEKRGLEAKQARHDQQLQQLNAKEIKILSGAYFESGEPLSAILKRHIMSQDNTSLIPVSVIASDPTLRPYPHVTHQMKEELRQLNLKIIQDQRHLNTLPSDAPERIQLTQDIAENTEQADQLHHRFVQILASESVRLYNHSPTSRALLEAQKRVDEMEKGEKNNFYDHLQVVLKKLKENDAHSGVGRADNAGLAAYEPIRIFSDYYETLGYEIKPSLPENEAPLKDTIYLDVRQEGDHLLFTAKLRDSNQAVISVEFNGNQIPGFSERVKAFSERIRKVEEKSNRPSRPPTLEELFGEAKDFKEEMLTLLKTRASLSPETKEQIPQSIREAIEKLIVLSKDPTKNMNATENIETCIFLRRSAVEKAIAAVEDSTRVLSQIACSDERKTQQKMEALTTLDITKKTLLRLNSQDSTFEEGKDTLPINKRLLEKFHIDMKVSTLDNLRTLLELDPDDIKNIGFTPGKKQEIVRLFMKKENNYWDPKLDELVWFLHEITPPQIQALFDITTPFLLSNFTNYPALLSSLEGEKRELLLHNLCKEIPSEMLRAFAKDATALGQIIPLIPNEHIVAALKETAQFNQTIFHDIVKYPASFNMLWALLPSEADRLEVISKENDQGASLLAAASHSPEVLTLLLGFIPADQRFKAITKKDSNGNSMLHTAAHHAASLKILLEVLLPSERFEAITLKEGTYGNTVLDEAANNEGALKVILESLTENERIAAVKTKSTSGHTALKTAVFYPACLDMLLAALPSTEERLRAVNEEVDRFGQTLLHWAISSPSSLKLLLNLYPEQDRNRALNQTTKEGKTVFEFAKLYPESFAVVLRYLPASERLNSIQQKDDKGQSILQKAMGSPQALAALLACLTAAERLALMKEKDQALLHEAARKPELLAICLNALEVNARIQLIKEKNRSFETIASVAAAYPDALKVLLESLPSWARFETIKHDISNLLRSPHSIQVLWTLLSPLELEQIEVLINAAVFYSNSFKLLLDLIPPPLRLDLLKRNISNIAFNTDSLVVVLTSLTDAERVDLIKEPNPMRVYIIRQAANDPEELRRLLDTLSLNDRLAMVHERDQSGKTILDFTAVTYPQSLGVWLDSLTPIQQNANRALPNEFSRVVRLLSQENLLTPDIFLKLAQRTDLEDLYKALSFVQVLSDPNYKQTKSYTKILRHENLRELCSAMDAIEQNQNIYFNFMLDHPAPLKLVSGFNIFNASLQREPMEAIIAQTYINMINEAKEPEIIATAFAALNQNKMLNLDNALFVRRSDNPSALTHILIETQRDKTEYASSHFKLFKSEPHTDLIVGAIKSIFTKHEAQHKGKQANIDFKQYKDKEAVIKALKAQLLPHLDENAQLKADSQDLKKNPAYLTLQTLGRLPDSQEVSDYQHHNAYRNRG